LLTDPLQIAALQQQLLALAMSNGGGDFSVSMPPVNVTQVPWFRTANDSFVFHMTALLQNLPQPFESQLRSCVQVPTQREGLKVGHTIVVDVH
jgi:hypothetical protein